MHMICPVGQRATAIVIPIKAFFEENHTIDKTSCRFTLLHTNSKDDLVKKVRDKCADWIKINVNGAIIDPPRIFPANEQEVGDLISDDESLYFNANGGMAWQTSYLSLLLPERTMCIASDYQKLYHWPLLEDVEKAESCALSDLGLDTYLSLDDQISIKKRNKQNDSLSTEVRNALKEIGEDYRWSVTFKNKAASNWQSILTPHVILVKERCGRLILLLDLCNGHSEISSNQKKALERYRTLNTLINEIRYETVLVTDNRLILKRAIADGISVIKIEEIKDWLNRQPKKPKSTIPDGGKTKSNDKNNPFSILKTLNIMEERSVNRDITPPSFKPLHVCLGDNTTPTLRLAMTGKYSPIMLWYDAGSKQIDYLADIFKKIVIKALPSIEVILNETDHRGKGILSAYSDKLNGHVNITPGTKMQSIALSVAARKANNMNNVTSIMGSNVTGVISSSQKMSCEQLPLETLLSIQIPPFSEKKDSQSGRNLWEWIMKQLANGALSLGTTPYLLDMKYNGRKAFRRIAGNNSSICCVSDRKIHNLIEADALEGGFWWEYTVAQSIKDQLQITVFTQVKWHWPDSSRNFMSELDVIFTMGGDTWVVSCKTEKEFRNVLPLKSEAERRLGRFVHCCLAVPHTNINERGKSVNGVLLLTPEILINGTELKKVMNTFSEKKRTTGK